MAEVTNEIRADDGEPDDAAQGIGGEPTVDEGTDSQIALPTGEVVSACVIAKAGLRDFPRIHLCNTILFPREAVLQMSANSFGLRLAVPTINPTTPSISR